MCSGGTCFEITSASGPLLSLPLFSLDALGLSPIGVGLDDGKPKHQPSEATGRDLGQDENRRAQTLGQKDWPSGTGQCA